MQWLPLRGQVGCEIDNGRLSANCFGWGRRCSLPGGMVRIPVVIRVSPIRLTGSAFILLGF